MFAAFWNAFKVKELRSRLLFTAGIIILVRIAANIPCPGIDAKALAIYVHGLRGSAGGLMNLFDLFSGGALLKFAIATLGIMPYITSSIIIQLLVPVLPSLEKLSRQGEHGRQKINQYTRYFTVLICVFQGVVASMTMLNPGRAGLTPADNLVTTSAPVFVFMTVIILTATTMIMMWLGEQATERGIGNGVSIIITVNIVARMPAAIAQLIEMARSGSSFGGGDFRMVHLLILLMVFALVTAATIMLTQGIRRIPIQMVRKSVGNQMGAGSTYLPLKVNFSGVMPIIFAGAIMSIPGILFSKLGWVTMAKNFTYGSAGYIIIYGVLILLFCYFWVANQFNPIQIADNLKKEGAYIPGVRPGQPTADFLDSTMTKVTFAGAIFLTALAVFPMFLSTAFSIPFLVASFFGGTSLLIMVGVVLDTLSQLESHLSMRNYDGFLTKGHIRNRRGN